MKKAEELRLRDGHSRDRDEKRMWSRDRKVNIFKLTHIRMIVLLLTRYFSG